MRKFVAQLVRRLPQKKNSRWPAKIYLPARVVTHGLNSAPDVVYGSVSTLSSRSGRRGETYVLRALVARSDDVRSGNKKNAVAHPYTALVSNPSRLAVLTPIYLTAIVNT